MWSINKFDFKFVLNDILSGLINLLVCPQSNTILNVNWETGEVDRIDSSSLLEAAAEKLIKNFRHSQVHTSVLRDLTPTCKTSSTA